MSYAVKTSSSNHRLLELARIASFKDSKFHAPADRAYACRLGRHGFYRTEDDKILCGHCKTVVPISSAVSEDPIERHRRLNPTCPLFTGRVVAPRPESPKTILDKAIKLVDQLRIPDNAHDVNLMQYESDVNGTTERLIDILKKSVERNSQVTTMVTGIAAHDVPSLPIMIDRFNPDYDMLRAEIVRMSTFHDWPETNPIAKIDFVKAGLFYTGEGDRVQCAFCRNYLKNWTPGDEPMVEHKKHFKECRFVKGLDLGTVEVESLGTNRKKIVEGLNMREHDLNTIVNPKKKGTRVIQCGNTPRHPEFADEPKRVESFAGKPRPEGQNINVIANAGYFYTGPGDKVRCFYCNGSLNHWSPMDEPWVEHAKFFPRCGFLRSKRDPGYIEVIQKNFKEEQEQIAKSLTLTSTVITLNERKIKEAMRSPTVVMAMEMGYTAETIKKVIAEKITNTGSEFLDVETLVETIINMSATMTETASITTETISPETLDAKSILDTNKKLWGIKTCKVCLDEEVNVVFLPCGHLACCNSCAPSLRQCAMCRAVIRGTVRVFIY